jgi:hypothetical protein
MKTTVLILSVGISTAAMAGEGVAVATVALPTLPLGLVSFQKTRALNLAVSPGAAAFRAPGDLPGRIWTITDRGPVIDCSEEREVAGGEDKAICQPERRGKIYLLPGYVPSIYAIDLAGESGARFSEMLPLRGRSGKYLTGLTNFANGPRAEASYAADGRTLDPDPSGVEPGGLVRLADGTFWIAEKFGSSLLEVAPDGQVLRRLVPSNLAEVLKGADYPIEPILPATISLRQVTRGFDGLAVSPDERFLYVSMQNALANPGVEAYRHSPAVRIWKIERATGRIAGEFVYPLDAPASFNGESGIVGRPLRQSDVRVAEIVAVGEDRLLVLERLRNATRVYKVWLDPERRLPAALGDEKMRPSLEELFPEVWEIAGVQPLAKQLIVDSDKLKGLGGRLSAMAVISPRELIVMSNNVYGAESAKSQMFRLTFAAPRLQ